MKVFDFVCNSIAHQRIIIKRRVTRWWSEIHPRVKFFRYTRTFHLGLKTENFHPKVKWLLWPVSALIGSLQGTVASLLALLQLYGTLAIKISQEQSLHYLIANLVVSPNMAMGKIRRTRYRFFYFVCLLLYLETVAGIFQETRQSSFWLNPPKIVSKQTSETLLKS